MFFGTLLKKHALQRNHQKINVTIKSGNPPTLISDKVFRMTFDCVCTVCRMPAGFAVSKGSPMYAAVFTSLSTASLQSRCSRTYDTQLCIFHHTLSISITRLMMSHAQLQDNPPKFVYDVSKGLTIRSAMLRLCYLGKLQHAPEKRVSII